MPFPYGTHSVSQPVSFLSPKKLLERGTLGSSSWDFGIGFIIDLIQSKGNLLVSKHFLNNIGKLLGKFDKLG